MRYDLVPLRSHPSAENLVTTAIGALFRAISWVVTVFFPSVLMLYQARSDSGWLWLSLFGEAIGLIVGGIYLFFSPHHLLGLFIVLLTTAVWVVVMKLVSQSVPSSDDWYSYSDLPMGDWAKPVAPAQPKEMDTLDSALDRW